MRHSCYRTTTLLIGSLVLSFLLVQGLLGEGTLSISEGAEDSYVYFPLALNNYPLPLLLLVDRIEGDVDEVAIQGNYAYVVLDSRLVVFDISVPHSPIKTGESIPIYGSVEDLIVSGAYAFVADKAAGLRIFDISNPAAPHEISKYDTPGAAYGVAVSGDIAFVADGPEILSIIDISDAKKPRLIGSSDIQCRWSYGIAVLGDRAYVGAYELYIFDIAVPSAPRLLGSYQPGDPDGFTRKGIVLSGNVALTGEHPIVPPGTGGGLRAIDISDPTAPRPIGFYDTPGLALGLSLSGDYAYIADGDGLTMLDASDLSSPAKLFAFDIPGSTVAVATKDSYVFVATKDVGLTILKNTLIE